MRLNQFKIGDIILKESGPMPLKREERFFGPVEFLAYENGLLFCNNVQLPDSFFHEVQYLQGIKAVQIGGKKIWIFKMSETDEDWFLFPVKTLSKIRAYLAVKYPEPAQEEAASEEKVEEGLGPNFEDFEPPGKESVPEPVIKKETRPFYPPGSDLQQFEKSRGAGFVED